MMKTVCIIFSVTLLAVTSCQQTTEPLTVNLEAVETSINDAFDNFNNAFLAEDVDSLVSFLSEDLMVLGNGLNEAYNKKAVTDGWTQMFAAGMLEYEPFGERLIIIAPDGKSATVVEQYMMPVFTEILPYRNAYYIIKVEDDWKILLINTNLTVGDELLPTINAALTSD